MWHGAHRLVQSMEARLCKLIGVNGLQRCPPDDYLSDLCLAAAGAAASKNRWQHMVIRGKRDGSTVQ